MDGKAIRGDENVNVLVHPAGRVVTTNRLGPSPYIVGSEAVKPERQEMFFGRAGIIDTIQRQLLHPDNRNVVLLEGNRRTGKSSILWQLMRPGLLPGWLPVLCDLQGGTGATGAVGIPTAEFYRRLARVMGEQLMAAGVNVWFPGVPAPKPGELFSIAFRRVLDHISSDLRPFETFEIFLAKALQAAEPKRVLLIFDEFDKLYEGIANGVLSPAVPEQLRYLIQTYGQLSAVISGSRRLKSLRENYFSVLFGLGVQIHVSSIPPEDARRLVTDPVAGQLSYLDSASLLVVELCAGHPYLIQSLCNRIFENAARSDSVVVTVDAVEVAASDLVDGNEHFRTRWEYAGTSRRRLILALCEMHASEPDPVDLSFLAVKLEELGVHVAKESMLGDDLDYLRESELVEFDTSYRGGTYRISIPLLERWIRITQDFSDVLARAREEAEEVSP